MMADGPRIKVAECPLRCPGLRQDTILPGNKYVQLGTKRFCLRCAGERRTQTAEETTRREG